MDDRFEIVIVDNCSSDGSLDYLTELHEQGRIKLIVSKCTRGKGRQIALEQSTGDYVISQVDMDDVFDNILSEVLAKYHEYSEGKVLHLVTSGSPVTIAPRRLLLDLGGWNDLQVAEDWELWARAASFGVYQSVDIDLVLKADWGAEHTALKSRLRRKFLTYRDLLRVGRPIFATDEKEEAWFKMVRIPIALTATVAAFLLPAYRDHSLSNFNPYAAEYALRMGPVTPSKS
jgi:glycosyltransferase involved in cell wall biosynthesis